MQGADITALISNRRQAGRGSAGSGTGPHGTLAPHVSTPQDSSGQTARTGVSAPHGPIVFSEGSSAIQARSAHPRAFESHSSLRTARPLNCSNLPIPNILPVYRTKWACNGKTRSRLTKAALIDQRERVQRGVVSAMSRKRWRGDAGYR
jgi:hypothetical protein